MIDCCSQHARSEEVNTIEVRYVYPSRWVKKKKDGEFNLHWDCTHVCCLKRTFMSLPGVREKAIRAVLLHVHAEETHVHAVNLLEGEKCFGSVGEAFRHLSCVDKPETKQEMNPTCPLKGQPKDGKIKGKHEG